MTRLITMGDYLYGAKQNDGKGNTSAAVRGSGSTPKTQTRKVYHINVAAAQAVEMAPMVAAPQPAEARGTLARILATHAPTAQQAHGPTDGAPEHVMEGAENSHTEVDDAVHDVDGTDMDGVEDDFQDMDGVVAEQEES